jgi:hypothetical protein
MLSRLFYLRMRSASTATSRKKNAEDPNLPVRMHGLLMLGRHVTSCPLPNTFIRVICSTTHQSFGSLHWYTFAFLIRSLLLLFENGTCGHKRHHNHVNALKVIARARARTTVKVTHEKSTSSWMCKLENTYARQHSWRSQGWGPTWGSSCRQTATTCNTLRYFRSPSLYHEISLKFCACSVIVPPVPYDHFTFVSLLWCVKNTSCRLRLHIFSTPGSTYSVTWKHVFRNALWARAMFPFGNNGRHHEPDCNIRDAHMQTYPGQPMTLSAWG